MREQTWRVIGWASLALYVAVTVACVAYRGDDHQVVDKGVGIAWSWPVGAGPAVDNSGTGASVYKVDRQSILSVYDGDTFFIRLPECADALPWLCARIGVRVDGVDTPEMRGACAEERAAAVRARGLLQALLESSGSSVMLVNVRPEKYGRLLASVKVGPRGAQHDVAALMIQTRAARPYAGGTRSSWCELN